MADDLLDDYWLEEALVEEKGSEKEDETKENGIKEKKKKGKKNVGLHQLDNKIDIGNGTMEVEEESSKVKKKKKKLKRKPNEEVKDVVESPAKKRKSKKSKDKEVFEASLDAMWKFFETEFKKTLTDIEIQDIKPDADDWFLKESESIPRDDITQLSRYLTNVVPNWGHSCSVLTKKERKGCPLMLILTSSAVRAVDLLRHTSSFKGEDCKTAKLFAKHFKVEDQGKLLREKVTHLAVGTPHRILTLIEEKHLHVSKLKYVVVDWTWCDVKMRRISNMPMVKDSFVQLFQKYLYPKCKKGTLSVGLF